MFLVVSWNEGWYAYTINELSEQTPWRPVLWPFKMMVPLAALLLLIQGVSETIKSVWAARTGEELEHKDKYEGSISPACSVMKPMKMNSGTAASSSSFIMPMVWK